MTKKHYSWIRWRPLVFLGIFLLLWGLVPPIIKGVLRLSFNEIQAPLWVATAAVQDLQKYWGFRMHSKQSLIESCLELSRRNAYLELKIQEQAGLAQKNKALESLLKLPEQHDYYYEVARVCRRDMGTWWNRMIIRKGRNYGITEGAGVVYSGGVVGKITQVNATTAVVELITSPLFRMAAHFDGDQRPVCYQGKITQSFQVPQGGVRDVPTDCELKEPLTLVSSALGGIFPDGIFIGTIQTLEADKDGLFLNGRVELNRALLSLKEVAVLLPLNS